MPKKLNNVRKKMGDFKHQANWKDIKYKTINMAKKKKEKKKDDLALLSMYVCIDKEI